MAEGDLDNAKQTTADQPPVLEYYTPQPSSGVAHWLRRLPRPSWFTVVVLLLTAAAAIWFSVDHAAWVVVRQFDGGMSRWGSPANTISADGKLLLAFLADKKTIRVYELETGKIVRDIRLLVVDVESASLSPDGTRVWSIGHDGQATLWDVSNGQPLASLVARDHSGGFDLFCTNLPYPFSPNGQWVTATNENNLVVCDGHSGTVVARLPGGFYALFSPDSRYLAALCSAPRQVHIWDTKTWQPVAVCATDVTNGILDSDGHRLAFSPDSKTLAIAFDGRVDLWDAATNHVSPAFANVQKLMDCFFSPDGRYLLAHVYNQSLEEWDVKARKQTRVITINPYWSWPAISPDSSRVVNGEGICRFPSFSPIENVDVGNQSAWAPGRQAFITNGSTPTGECIRLFQLRRPEAWYGVLCLPQGCLLVLGVLATAWLIRRDVQRWRQNPPALR